MYEIVIVEHSGAMRKWVTPDLSAALKDLQLLDIHEIKIRRLLTVSPDQLKLPLPP